MSPSDPARAPQAPITGLDRAGRRLRLREFQAQLVDRMQAARSGEDNEANRLGILAGDTRWLVGLRDAGEIVSVGAITPVPLTHDWFLGLTNIRGSLISVIDFARFQGLPAAGIDKDCRILAFAPALGFNSGLLVSRVMGLRNIAQMEQQSEQPSGAGGDPAAPWTGKSYVDRESLVWNELDLSLVVRDPRFLQVGL
jgi:twitching motility protein PilI